MPRKSGTEVLGDATRGRTSLSRNASRRRVASIHGSRRLTVGVILKDAHLSQSLASGHLPDPISQTNPLDGVLHCNLQVRRDAQKWVSAGFVTSRNAGFRTMLGQGARWENRDDRGKTPGQTLQPSGQGGHRRIAFPGAPFSTCHMHVLILLTCEFQRSSRSLWTSHASQEAQVRDDLLEDCLFPSVWIRDRNRLGSIDRPQPDPK